ncbi:MAG: AMP-binding protein [Alcaligenaceae bacterium]
MWMKAIAQGMSIAYYAEHSGDQPAVIEPERVTSFAMLNGRANQLVRALRQRGIKAGDAIALLCSNRLEFVDVAVAAERSGLRITLINTHLTGDEVGYIVDNCEARAFVAEARYSEQAKTAQGLAINATVCLAVGGSIPGFVDYESALASETAGDIEDPTLGSRMLYTSGTTGQPKGVYRAPEYSLPNLLGSLDSIAQAGYQSGAKQLHLSVGPLYHSAPFGISLTQPLLAGVGIVLLSRWDTETVLRLIEQHRITHTFMVPTMFHRLLSLPEDVKTKYDLSSLQLVIHGAASCPVSVKTQMMKWWGPILLEYYAATEGRGVTVSASDWFKRPGTVGKPTPSDHIRICDDDGRDQSKNTAGAVYLKAPAVGQFKYFKDESKTRAIYRGEYYTLGDIGYLDEEGWLFLTDRSANLIISGGVNIYPTEVEAVLLTHPAVEDVCVIGVPNEEWGEEVKAVIELHAPAIGSTSLASELILFCQEHLAHFKCPRSVDFSEKLPRLDNGKLYKNGLRDKYRAALKTK